MRLTIHPINAGEFRTGTLKGYLYRGVDCREGWLISYSSAGHDNSTHLVWLGGSFEAPSFYSAPPFEIDGRVELEIEVEPVDVTAEERSAMLGICWHWEVWEPTAIKGTCAIDSLERMIDLPPEIILDWFRVTGRNPAVLEDIITTLEEHDYRVDLAGPEGFGRFHDYRRLVLMYRKDDPAQGHAVLIYENDTGIFDASGFFKKVGDIVWSDSIGYNRGQVLKIGKKTD